MDHVDPRRDPSSGHLSHDDAPPRLSGHRM
jgi:hypothetical protein